MLVLAKLGARIWISCIVVAFGAVTLGELQQTHTPRPSVH